MTPARRNPARSSEQLASLRVIPGLEVVRPADANPPEQTPPDEPPADTGGPHE